MIRFRIFACAGLAVLFLGAWGSDPALGQTQTQAQAQTAPAPALVLNASAEAAWAEVRAALSARAEHPDEAVREHVRWALEQQECG